MLLICFADALQERRLEKNSITAHENAHKLLPFLVLMALYAGLLARSWSGGTFFILGRGADLVASN